MKKALLHLHLAVFLWGFTGVLGRVITLNAGLLVWWRMGITVVSLFILLLLSGKLPKIKITDLLKIGGIGCILALHWLCFYGSIKLANVSVSLTCLTSSGLISAILEPLFFKRKIKRVHILLSLCTLGGVALVYCSNLQFSAGIYVGLTAAVLTVLVSILNKKVVADYDASTLTFYQLAGGFIGFSVLMPIFLHFFPDPHILPGKHDWAWLLVLSWVCTIFTYFLYVNALRKVSVFTLNIALTLEPVYGILLAFLIYHENKSFSSSFYWGLLLIFMAVIWQMRNTLKGNKN